MRSPIAILLLISVFSITALQAQLFENKNKHTPQSKAIIDIGALDRWFSLGPESDCQISPDGKFVTWSIWNQPYKSNTFVISATEGNWKIQIPGLRGVKGFFSGNSLQFIYQVRDTLYIVELGGKQVRYIHPIADWQRDSKNEWLAYQLKNEEGLILENLFTRRSKHFNKIASYYFTNDSKWLIATMGSTGSDLLLYNTTTGTIKNFLNTGKHVINDKSNTLILEVTNAGKTSIEMVDLVWGRRSVIWQSNNAYFNIKNYVFDEAGVQLAFVVEEKIDVRLFHSIWCYKKGMPLAQKLTDDNSTGIASHLFIDYLSSFSSDGKFIRICLTEKPDRRSPGPNAIKLDVWSYLDTIFYTSQPRTFIPASYAAVLNIKEKQVVQIEHKSEFLEGSIEGDYVLISKKKVGDRFWEYKEDSIWLKNLSSGLKTLLPVKKAGWLYLSPGGKYVMYFDSKRGRHYYRYDIKKAKEEKMTGTVPDWKLGVDNPFEIGWSEHERVINHVVAAKTKDGNEMLIYDNYDIWLIDLNGVKAPHNVTNAYGCSHKISFRLPTLSEEPLMISTDSAILLSAFDERTRENGFYSVQLKENANPKKLFMGPYTFRHDRNVPINLEGVHIAWGSPPLKASDTDAWIVRRESVLEAPNYFFTRDFKEFKPLTYLHPQNEYNWMTTELVKFNQGNGIESMGILYKPSNFDSSKKYPVIFYYYEQMSFALNRYVRPSVSDVGKPNIAWLVNRGYLVFTPDIYFEKGWMGKSALYAIEGAALKLKNLSYVDEKCLAIVGHSKAGGLTNYIVTHSTLFAAAYEGCGSSNMISSALQLAGINDEGGSRLTAETLYGSSMWERPDQWINESAVLNADKVTTPLLIMHNKNDGAVPFAQAVEMFTALRRLNKKVWLLQYDEGGHGPGGKDAKDCGIRMTQFFDHYLKGAPPPKWMCQGIPRRLKQIEDGLELDHNGKCGISCPVCDKKR